MEEITVLEVSQNRHQEMNDLGIVVCTYKKVGGGEVDAISYDYQQQFTELEEVLVYSGNNEI
jgi:hypothetical protein